MAATLIVLLAFIIGVPMLLLRYAREPTVRWFNRFLTVRRIISGVIVLLFGFTALFSGVLYLMVIGSIILGGVWLFVLTQTDMDIPDPRRYL